jgi:signal transduction histidine kinase
LSSIGIESGLVLILDERGTVRRILHNGMGLEEPSLAGRPFTAALERSSFEKALNFLVELRDHGAVFDWQMTVTSTAYPMNLFFGGVATDREVLIVASPTKMGQYRLYDFILKQGSRERGKLSFDRATQERVERMREVSCQDERIFEDLTRLNNELANLQRELHKKNVELNRLDRLKNQFLGMAAHDLRSPLFTITMYLEFLTDELWERLNDEEREYFNAVRSSSSYMLELVNDLLDIATIESGKLTLNLAWGDIIGSVDRSLRMCSPFAGRKGVDIVLRTAEALPKMRFDRLRIEQVMNNLLSNAVKFSHPGGMVTVGAHREGGNVIITVEDEGEGIPDGELQQLFTIFRKTGSRGTKGERGSGLGLAIVHKIVTEHGGSIEVESRIGEGSTFSVNLPVEGP